MVEVAKCSKDRAYRMLSLEAKCGNSPNCLCALTDMKIDRCSWNEQSKKARAEFRLEDAGE